MKRLLGALAVLAGTALFIAGPANAGDAKAGVKPKPAAASPAKTGAIKIGYVDFNRVQTESKAGKDAIAAVEKMFNDKQAQLNQRQDELEKLLKELDKQSAVLKPAVKQQKEDKLQKEYKDLQRFKSDSEDELNRKKAEMSKNMFGEISAIINSYGNQEGYTLILERSVVLYAPAAVDITDKIIKAYDESKQ